MPRRLTADDIKQLCKLATQATFAIALTFVTLPIAILAGLFSKGRKCTPQELAADLRKLADSAGGETAWDQLESVPILDRRLETIRREAMAVNLPLQAEDRAKLALLASKADALH